MLAADVSGPHTITERASTTGDTTDIDQTSGTLSFTDVDLTDTHTVAKSFVSAIWSKADSSTASIADPGSLTRSETDSTATGAGSVGFTYSAADNKFDFLAAGETLTVT